MLLNSFIVLALLIANGVFSVLNAIFVGRSWADIQAIDSQWQRIVVFSTFMMSGCGFTWCYLMIFAFLANGSRYMDPATVQMVLNLGYMVIILPVIGCGLAIWMDSVTTAYRRRNIASIGTAAWNSFAQVHNTYQAIDNLLKILKVVAQFFKGRGSSKGKGQLLVVLLVIFALLLGFMTAYVIVMMSAGAYAKRVIREMNDPQAKNNIPVGDLASSKNAD